MTPPRTALICGISGQDGTYLAQDAMWKMLQQNTPEDFVIATGETHALQDFIAEAFAAVNLDWRDHVDSDPALMRPADLGVSRADPTLAARKLGWKAQMNMAGVVYKMVAATKTNKAD